MVNEIHQMQIDAEKFLYFLLKQSVMFICNILCFTKYFAKILLTQNIFLTQNISQNTVRSTLGNINCSLIVLILFLSNLLFSNRFSNSCFVRKISLEVGCGYTGRETVVVILTLFRNFIDQ